MVDISDLFNLYTAKVNPPAPSTGGTENKIIHLQVISLLSHSHHRTFFFQYNVLNVRLFQEKYFYKIIPVITFFLFLLITRIWKSLGRTFKICMIPSTD